MTSKSADPTYWNFGIGEMPGEVYEDAEGLRNMKDLGTQLAWLLKIVQQGK